MIDLKRGNILEADAEALVNTVNCVGVMGKGIALQFKKAFPENFAAYADGVADEVREAGPATDPGSPPPAVRSDPGAG